MSQQSDPQPPPLPPRGGDLGAPEVTAGAVEIPTVTTPSTPPQPYPLLISDPPRIGNFWLDARLSAREAGVVFVAHADDEPAVMVLVLAEGAAHDAAARDRLAGEVNKLHAESVVARGGDGQDGGRLGHKYRSEADDPVVPGDPPIAPWVALAYDGSPAAVAEADRVLAEVDLSRLALQGAPAGPGYRLHWIERVRPGAARLWPLPWPGRHDRAGWLSILASWLLMVLLAALAVLIAILIFQSAPPVSPPPPVPPTGSPPPPTGSPPPQSPSSASPPPSSGSPSPSSGSPSPASASPSSASGSPSPASGSPSPASASPSGVGSPTPDSRL